jgi:hypothetical protein
MPQVKLNPEDSDYDELEGSDAEEDTKEDPNVFKVREPLEPPRTTTYSAIDLFSD